VPPPPDPADPRLASGAAWNALCDALRASDKRVLGPDAPAAPADRAEGFRYLLRFLEAGIRLCVEYAEPDHPELCRMIERGMTWGLDCPDCLYLYAPVRGGDRYRLWGTRGTANHFDVQVNYGHFASGDISSWGTLDSKSGGELELDADGRFELWLAPEPRSGNALRAATNAEFLLIRQYFGDWERERPADLWIERVGAPASAPRPRSEQIAARLERLVSWIEKGGALWETLSRAMLSLPPNTLNVVRPPDEEVRGGLEGQVYGLGNFRCAPNAAVVLEFTPPECRHWSVSLASWWWETIDYATRQSSLNGSQARLDADGRFRGVIAHVDPGVPNWLDAAGHTAGTLAVRFLRAAAAPEVRTRVVPLAEVRRQLPPDTPRVTPEARAETLRRRHRSVMARYRR
jgi:hypothetical protein